MGNFVAGCDLVKRPCKLRTKPLYLYSGDSIGITCTGFSLILFTKSNFYHSTSFSHVASKIQSNLFLWSFQSSML